MTQQIFQKIIHFGEDRPPLPNCGSCVASSWCRYCSGPACLLERFWRKSTAGPFEAINRDFTMTRYCNQLISVKPPLHRIMITWEISMNWMAAEKVLGHIWCFTWSTSWTIDSLMLSHVSNIKFISAVFGPWRKACPTFNQYGSQNLWPLTSKKTLRLTWKITMKKGKKRLVRNLPRLYLVLR